MYFAVQAMAAELTTGALVMMQIKKSGKKISMLVANNNGNFTKKATGRITFTCLDGDKIEIDRETREINLLIDNDTWQSRKSHLEIVEKPTPTQLLKNFRAAFTK